MVEALLHECDKLQIETRDRPRYNEMCRNRRNWPTRSDV